jgi:exopolysaccharide production protein ExoQ
VTDEGRGARRALAHHPGARRGGYAASVRGQHDRVIVTVALAGTALVAGLIHADVSLVVVVAGIAAVVVAWWLNRLDGWQRLYVVSLVLLTAAASSFEAAASAAFYLRYAAVGALVGWTWHAHRCDQVPLSSRPGVVRRLVWALHALTVLAAASTAWSFDPAETAQQAVALAMLSALVHLLVTRRWSVPERIAADFRVAYLVLVAAAAVGLVGAQIGIPETGGFDGRLQGVFANPNLLGITMALAAPLGWGLYRESRRASYLAGLAPVLFSVVESGSRTAQLGVAVAGLWLLLRAAWHPRYVFPLVVGGVAVGVLFYVIAGGLHFLAAVEGLSRFTSNDGGDLLNSRTLAWTAALHLWKQQPWLGYGYQAGEALFIDQLGAAGFFFSRPSVHNSYLQLLLELGVVGAALLVVLLVLVLAAILRSRMSGVNTGVIGVLVAGLAIHMTESAIFGTGQVYPFVYWLAAAAALMRYPVRWAPKTVGVPLPPQVAVRAVDRGSGVESSRSQRYDEISQSK